MYLSWNGFVHPALRMRTVLVFSFLLKDKTDSFIFLLDGLESGGDGRPVRCLGSGFSRGASVGQSTRAEISGGTFEAVGGAFEGF